MGPCHVHVARIIKILNKPVRVLYFLNNLPQILNIDLLSAIKTTHVYSSVCLDNVLTLLCTKDRLKSLILIYIKEGGEPRPLKPLRTSHCFILSVRTAYGLILALNTAYRLTTISTFYHSFKRKYFPTIVCLLDSFRLYF